MNRKQLHAVAELGIAQTQLSCRQLIFQYSLVSVEYSWNASHLYAVVKGTLVDGLSMFLPMEPQFSKKTYSIQFLLSFADF